LRRISGFVLSLSLVAPAGCVYGFSGGGLPPAIRTVAVMPFENVTADPTITSEINRAVREAVEDRLGLRPAGEKDADAIVTGTIRRYEPDLPVAFQGVGPEEQKKVEVTRRLVQLVVDVRIYDQKTEKVLWERMGLMVDGDYETGNEREGRKKALEKLTTNIVDGAQSQW
jgi:Lipopolysaccharide-assembly